MQKIICLLAFGFAIALNSCKSDSNHPKNYFHYNQIGGLETLDPAFAKNLSIMWGVHFLYNTLVEVDENGQLLPSLAKDWTASADGHHYTFRIDSNVYFHDNAIFEGGKGRKMTAHDIVYSFNRLIDPQTASSGAWIFNDRVRKQTPFVALDSFTFQLHLSTPFQPLLEMLSMPYCSVVPKEAVEKWGKDFRNHPVGTGPFQFQLWDENNILMLERNPNYWERDENGVQLPYLDGVTVSFNETRVMEFLLFQQQKIDFINGIDGSVKDLVLTKKGTLKKEFEPKIRLNKQVYYNTEYMGFLLDTSNKVLHNSALKQQKVRQAINWAINKEKIVTYYRNGIGLPAHRGFIPLGMPIDTSVQYGYNYQPQKAIQLLKEAGWKDKTTFGTITINSPESSLDICNFIATELQDIGLDVKVQVMQPGMLRQLMSKSEVPFFKAQWIADYPDPETFVSFFYSAFPAPPNYTRYQNKQFDQWYNKALGNISTTERQNLYAKMDSLIMADAAIAPLFYDEIIHFTHKNIEGLRSNGMNIIDVKRVKKTR